jgi:predicted RNase H-like HicB family nuclease
MDIKQWIRKLFGNEELPKNQIPTTRVSIEPAKVFTPRTLEAKFRFLNPRYPREWLDVIEKAVVANPILSQTHNLIITLANTGHTVKVQGQDEEKAMQELEELAFVLNTDHLINQLIAQINISGALSSEIVVDKNLTGIKKIALVPARYIWFDYNPETDEYEPYQWVGIEDPIKLNPYTYKYMPLLTLDGSPYAIPPFLASLSTIETVEELLSELQGLATKLGLVGFLDVKFPQLPKAPNETEKEYQDRSRQFLQQFGQDVAENMSKGVFLHFEGTEAKFEEISGNASGIKEIIELLERWTIEGAKAQPSLLGFSTGYTETWSTVALHTFISQLSSIQTIVKRFLEYAYKLHLLLKGFNIDDVDVEFNPLPDFHPDKVSKAKLDDTQRIIQMLQAGIISVEEARTELGLDG